MSSSVRRLGLAVLLWGSITVPASASGAVPFKACSTGSTLGCATVQVPLDRSGAVPGTVGLAVERLRSLGGNGSTAVVAIAGGPGQAATPLAADFAIAMRPALAGRDLVVFDQRGTGRSQPLRCRAFETAAAGAAPGPVIRSCAGQLGPARGHFTTADTVEDIESLRQALGYSRLVLYGTSYGTKVALAYAMRHPANVERLVLDSVVLPSGPDVFGRSTLAAVPAMLRALCGGGNCGGITADPVADLQRLVARLAIGAVAAPVVDARGHGRRVAVSHDDLIDIVVAGDEDPTLRADLPGAVSAALSGDYAPLARLRLNALSGDSSSGIDQPLYFATVCEELPLPFARGPDAATKLAQARAAAAALPPGPLLPFDAASALHAGPSADCSSWPQATDAAESFASPLPQVPTLILSGANDVRTPTADAAALAAEIPGAQLIVVPNDGHSVIGTDPSLCSREAVRAFFAGAPAAPCRPRALPALLRPTPVPPRDLARVPGASRSARALNAAALTLLDAKRQVTLGVLNALSSGALFNRVRTGGLRGGYAEASVRGVVLHRYALIGGVRVDGRLSPSYRGGVAISGAAGGRLVLGPAASLSGTLAGRRVHAQVQGLAAVAAAGLAGTRTDPVWRTR
ncbi:MAG: hypothetical protein NVSMB51_14990 [Solirubrobacteraceae bacterium]